MGHSRPRGDVFIRGRVVRREGPENSPTLRIKFGIESYFVPEGTGRRVETARDIAVEVSLREGRAVIRCLYLDGQPFP